MKTKFKEDIFVVIGEEGTEDQYYHASDNVEDLMEIGVEKRVALYQLVEVTLCRPEIDCKATKN